MCIPPEEIQDLDLDSKYPNTPPGRRGDIMFFRRDKMLFSGDLMLFRRNIM